jgi:hypothetical protein
MLLIPVKVAEFGTVPPIGGGDAKYAENPGPLTVDDADRVVNAPVFGVLPIGPGFANVDPFKELAFRFGTLVVLATTKGGVPVAWVEVICTNDGLYPCTAIGSHGLVPLPTSGSPVTESPKNRFISPDPGALHPLGWSVP